jgi:hypothetical protein
LLRVAKCEAGVVTASALPLGMPEQVAGGCTGPSDSIVVQGSKFRVQDSGLRVEVSRSRV